MPKTPDEIKKGMECCITDNCKECPYYPLYEVFGCKLARAKDSLALIRQLEKDKADLLEERELNDFLRDKVKQLEAERDAAVDGLKSNCTCPECKYFSDDIQDPCRGCKPTDSKFEWRGVQKEESTC